MNSIHETEIHFQKVGDAITLDKKQEANLSRIVQELVTNSIKHAMAQEIADELCVSIKTVETHHINLISKLRAGNSVGLIKNAIEKGLVKN